MKTKSVEQQIRALLMRAFGEPKPDDSRRVIEVREILQSGIDETAKERLHAERETRALIERVSRRPDRSE